MDGRAAKEWVPVSVSWEHAYRTRAPAEAELLGALSVLDLAVVTSPAVGAAVGLRPAETAECLAGLALAGWTVPAGDDHAMAAPARDWLAANAAGLVEPARAVPIVRGFAEYHTAALDLERRDPAEAGAWLARHRAEVLAGVRACDRDGLRPVGTRLAHAAWPSAGSVSDPRWWTDLAGAGEALAVADRDPPMLADLLHRSAATFAEHGDRPRAEAQWVRALAITRRAHLDDRGVAVLTELGALYQGWGRLSKALDAYLALVELRRAAGDAAGAAEALTKVAATMYAADRPASAADYFAKADAAMTPVTEAAGCPPDKLAGHALILAWWGRALWDRGEHLAARRQWSRALAMTVDVDDKLADHARALLATAAEDPLPGDYPITAG